MKVLKELLLPTFKMGHHHCQCGHSEPKLDWTYVYFLLFFNWLIMHTMQVSECIPHRKVMNDLRNSSGLERQNVLFTFKMLVRDFPGQYCYTVLL